MKVGVVLPHGPDAPGSSVYGWDHLRQVAQTAEAEGLDSIWVYDHLIFRFDGRTTGIHESWTILSAVAAVTSRVELGILVLAMPFRNPALLAKMASTLDEVSAGRLILGVGAGWHEPEFTAFDYPFDHRVGRFEEALRVLAPLIRDGRVTFEGRWHAARDVEIIPRYRRADGSSIPLLIAGKRPRMLRLVAEYADAWNTAWLDSASQLPERVEPLHAALAEAGRDPASLEVTVGVNVVLPRYGAGMEAGSALTGSEEEVAAGLRAFGDAGATHLMLSVEPGTPEAVAHAARATALARG